MDNGGTGVVGTGNIAQALAAHLSSSGHEVRIYGRRPEVLAHVREAGYLRTGGMLDGTHPIAEVTGDPARLAETSSLIFVATVTTAYRDIAATLAPVLRPGHVVVVFSSKLFGSVEFANALRANGAPDGVDVLETDSIMAARVVADHTVMMARKRWNLLSSPDRTAVERHLPALAKAFPGLEAATNLVHRGVSDFGALAHVVISYANLGSIDRAEPVLFYEQGLSERTVCLLERMEAEFRAVARAYDADLLPMPEILDRYYGCDTSSLVAAMRSVFVYKGVPAPVSVDERLLHEDVINTLVPLEGLAEKAGVATPMVNAMVTLASTIGGEEYRETGRTLARLGLAELSAAGMAAWLRR
jgi:opine dehydrogenase